jgi:hypothetical protein
MKLIDYVRKVHYPTESAIGYEKMKFHQELKEKIYNYNQYEYGRK